MTLEQDSKDYSAHSNTSIYFLQCNLKFYRHQQTLSQSQLSIRSGLARSYLAEIETGRRNPCITKVYQIAIGLRIEPWILLKPISLSELTKEQENNLTSFDLKQPESKILTKTEHLDILIKNIKYIRKKRSWLQRDLANHSGLSEVFIQNIEQGKKVPTLESVEKIALAFNISVCCLVKGIDMNSIWFNNNMWL